MPSFAMKGDRDSPPGISVIKSFLDSHPLTSANRFCQIGANDAKALKSAFEKQRETEANGAQYWT